MSKLPLAVVDDLVTEHVGPNTDWVHVRTDLDTPIAAAIRHGTRDINRDVLVYWIDGGVPENFSLPGLNPAPVAMSTRFLEIAATFFGLLEQDLLDEDLLVEASERLCLQVIAELVLKGGDPALAAYLTARSVTPTDAVVIDPMTISQLELERRDERYMTVWFLALLHEIGHVSQRDQTVVLAPEDLQQRIDEAMARFPFPRELVEQLMRRLDEADRKHSLHPSQLQTEIAADLFGVERLWTATYEVMTAVGQARFSPSRLTQAVITMFAVLELLDMCARVARWATDVAADPRDEPWVSVAYAVRSGVLADMLTGMRAKWLGEDEDLQGMRDFRAFLAEEANGNQSRYDRIESGQDRAQRQVLFAVERERNLGDLLPDALAGTAGAVTRIEINRLVELADALAVEHPDIERLRQVAAASAPTDVHSYAVCWLFAADGSHSPFAVSIAGAFVVPAFRVGSKVVDSFEEAVRARLLPEFTLERATIVVDWEWDLAITCIRALPAESQPRARVAVEGTALFDRLIRSMVSTQQ